MDLTDAELSEALSCELRVLQLHSRVVCEARGKPF